jgi:PAS domain S-box-containing protein
LCESEERFRQVVESSPVGIFIQTEGIHRYFNPAALAMLGAENASQVVGRGYLEVIHPDSRASVMERARIVREEKKPVPFMEERLLRLDGTASDAELTAVPFIFQGRDGALVFLRDITERKREEEKRRALEQQLLQAQKIEAVGRLAAASQHVGQIDLLITDVVMPKMSGREISQTLGNQRPGLKTIYMSGYTDDAVLRHGIHKLGASFLQKPFSLGTLARKVRDTLDNNTGENKAGN